MLLLRYVDAAWEGFGQYCGMGVDCGMGDGMGVDCGMGVG